MAFDASASHTNPPGGTLTYSWAWGDGTSTGPSSTPTATHTFPSAGTYTVTLTVTDAVGTSTARVFTGQTVLRNGGPSATANRAVTVRLPLSGATPVALVADGDEATVTPLGLTTATPTAAPGPKLPVGEAPAAVAITPDARTAYVADRGSNTVTPIDLAGGQALAPIAVGSQPSALAVTPEGSAVYVADSGDATVQRITTATGAAGPAIPVGLAPSAIAITPNGAISVK